METGDTSLRVASFSCYLDAATENLAHKSPAQEKKINSSPVTKPPPFRVMFSKPSHDSILTNLRVDSFSYNLNTAVEDSNRIEDPTSAFTFSQETPRDGEIGVFSADKYFNMKLEYKTTSEAKTKYKNEVPENRRNLKPKAPSFCSESTSWNSRTALIPDNIKTRKHKMAIGRKIFTGFGCKGPCFDKKSVVDLISSKPTRTTGSERVDPKLTAASYKNQLLKIETLDESRPSIEVFGSSNRMRGDVATNMERKLSMLTWDAIPKSGKTSDSTASTTVVCDDMASEASSDLFEIDNILGSINYPSLITDDVSTCMSPNSHYAPSEASIQWSVVTASAAGYSVLSDCNDSVSVAGDLITKNHNPANRLSKAKVFEGPQKGRAVGLLGCKSHKAVDVAEKNVVCQKSNIDETGKSSRVKDNIDNALKLPRTLANGGLSVHYPSIL